MKLYGKDDSCLFDNGPIFKDVDIVSISYDNLVLVKLIAEIWKHYNVAKNMLCQETGAVRH